jgi:hypothetical protein
MQVGCYTYCMVLGSYPIHYDVFNAGYDDGVALTQGTAGSPNPSSYYVFYFIYTTNYCTNVML